MSVLLWVLLASLTSEFQSSTFCKAGFVDTYCLNMFLSLNILLSLLMLNENFVGYRSLGLYSWFLNVCSISI